MLQTLKATLDTGIIDKMQLDVSLARILARHQGYGGCDEPDARSARVPKLSWRDKRVEYFAEIVDHLLPVRAVLGLTLSWCLPKAGIQCEVALY
jgi:hypothetical protein